MSPVSLKLRLTLAFAGVAVLVFSALGFYLTDAVDRHMADLDRHALAGQLAAVARLSSGVPDWPALTARLNDALPPEAGSVRVLADEKGVIRFAQGNPVPAGHGGHGSVLVGNEAPVSFPGWVQAAGAEEGLRVVSFGAASYRVLAAPVETSLGRLHVWLGRDIRHHTGFLADMQRDFWLAVVAGSLLTALCGAFVARQAMQPVRALASIAGRISAEELAARLPMAGVPAELTELVLAFNAMLARLEKAFLQLSAYSADLAHELRTPLHALRIQSEVALSQPRSADAYRELLEANLESYERLSRMVSDLLLLAKAENGLLETGSQSLAFDVICREVAEYHEILAEGQQLNVETVPCTVVGDKRMLQRAIANLLANAFRHTPPSGCIALSLTTSAEAALLLVRNTGATIPPAVLPHVFERFVQGGNRGAGEGAGLGLAITRSIVRAHGGEITVRSGNDETSFLVTLPRSG